MADAAKEEQLSAALAEYISKALQARMNGTSQQEYNTIVSQISATSDRRVRDAAGLSRWYKGLSKSVSRIRPEPMRSLLEAIYSFEFQAPASTIKDYCSLLLSLASARGTLVVPTISKLVSMFLPPVHDDAGEEGAVDIAPYEVVLDRAHKTMEKLLKLSPASASCLYPQLVQHFPHMRLDAFVQQVYVKNLLRISEYAPSLRDRILSVLAERLIHIDVEINIGNGPEENDDDDDDEDEEDDDEDEVDSDHDDKLQFQFDFDGSESPEQRGRRRDSAGSVESFPESEASEVNDEEVAAAAAAAAAADPNRIMADKLDTLMCLLFEYLGLIRGGDPKLCDEVFGSLLRVFERYILKTHKSRFTQFLIFFFCSIKHTYAEAFLRRLLEVTFEQNASVIERTSAVAYVASFVARASYLRHVTAVSSFDLLLQWAHEYVDMYEAEKQHSGGNMEEHKVFYCICQAVFYIFCHRQRSLSHMRDPNQDPRAKYRFDHLVHSSLNPLKYCHDDVVAEFAATAKRLRVCSCSRVLQANAEFVAARQKQRRVKGRPLPFTRISGFFPFDPYRLKHSSVHIAELYQYYDNQVMTPDSFLGMPGSPAPESPMLSGPGMYSPNPRASPYMPWDNSRASKSIGVPMPALHLGATRRKQSMMVAGRSLGGARGMSLEVGSIASEMSSMSVSVSPPTGGELHRSSS